MFYFHACMRQKTEIILIKKKLCDNSRNPTQNKDPVDLRPIQKDVVNYVDITNNGLVVGVNPESRTTAFWDGFFTKHKNFFKISPNLIK